MLLMLAVGWQASAVRGDEATHKMLPRNAMLTNYIMLKMVRTHCVYFILHDNRCHLGMVRLVRRGKDKEGNLPSGQVDTSKNILSTVKRFLVCTSILLLNVAFEMK